LVDDFVLLSENWEDDDIPLKYSYFYKRQSIDSDYVSFGLERTNNQFKTKLAGSGSSLTIDLRARVSDEYGAYTEAF